MREEKRERERERDGVQIKSTGGRRRRRAGNDQLRLSVPSVGSGRFNVGPVASVPESH